MELPINGSSRPIRSKYLDSETPMLRHWFIFGSSSEGNVDISDGTDDIFINLSPEEATRIVAARDVFVNTVVSLFMACTEAPNS